MGMARNVGTRQHNDSWLASDACVVFFGPGGGRCLGIYAPVQCRVLSGGYGNGHH